MTLRRRYLGMLALALAIGAAALLAIPPAVRTDTAWGVFAGIALQAPLGWWAISSIGTDRFQLVWALGMALRFAAVALVALVLVPALGWNAVAVLGSMVAAVLTLLAMEVVTVVREHS